MKKRVVVLVLMVLVLASIGYAVIIGEGPESEGLDDLSGTGGTGETEDPGEDPTETGGNEGGGTNTGGGINIGPAPSGEGLDDPSGTGGTEGGGTTGAVNLGLPPGEPTPPSSSPGEETEGETQTIPTANANDVISLAFSQPGLAIRKIDIEFLRPVANFMITASSFDGAPIEVDDLTGTAFQYIELEKQNAVDDDIKQATIEFTIPKADITASNLGHLDYKMMRFNDGWDLLPTTYVREEGNLQVYQAESPGFSFFVIGVEEQQQEQQNNGGGGTTNTGGGGGSSRNIRPSSGTVTKNTYTGNVYKLYINSVQYSFKVTSVTKTSATFSITPGAQTNTLNVGAAKNIDLNSNNRADVNIKLTKLIGKSATFQFTQLDDTLSIATTRTTTPTSTRTPSTTPSTTRQVQKTQQQTTTQQRTTPQPTHTSEPTQKRTITPAKTDSPSTLIIVISSIVGLLVIGGIIAFVFLRSQNKNPVNIPDSIVNYMRMVLGKGYKIEAVKQLLMKQGWKEKDINEAYKRATRRR